MVSTRDERRKGAGYSLARVRELAAQGAVRYGSARVTRHVENLGYAPEHVHACLAGLEDRHCRGSVRYEGQRFWYDQYLVSFEGPSGHSDDLYIKMKLTRDCIVIVLASFHPEGWI